MQIEMYKLFKDKKVTLVFQHIIKAGTRNHLKSDKCLQGSFKDDSAKIRAFKIIDIVCDSDHY